MSRRALPLILACLSVSAAAPERVPVLVELFTSEGCSELPSCRPPARDTGPICHRPQRARRLLGPIGLARSLLRPRQYPETRGVRPSLRQRGTVHAADGDRWRRGVQRQRWPTCVRRNRAGGQTGTCLRQPIPHADRLKIETGAVARSTDVLLAVAEDRQASSQVTAGENRGRNLRHVAVVAESEEGWKREAGRARMLRRFPCLPTRPASV